MQVVSIMDDTLVRVDHIRAKGSILAMIYI